MTPSKSPTGSVRLGECQRRCERAKAPGVFAEVARGPSSAIQRSFRQSSLNRFRSGTASFWPSTPKPVLRELSALRRSLISGR